MDKSVEFERPPISLAFRDACVIFPAMRSSSDRLPLPRVLAFASVGMPLSAIGLPMAVFVAPMYAEQLGLGTTMVGLVFMILRFWDLGTDPVMGWLVDSKPTKRGRIKHWLVEELDSFFSQTCPNNVIENIVCQFAGFIIFPFRK